MTQEFLGRLQVRSSRSQVGRQGVTEAVPSDLLQNHAGLASRFDEAQTLVMELRCIHSYPMVWSKIADMMLQILLLVAVAMEENAATLRFPLFAHPKATSSWLAVVLVSSTGSTAANGNSTLFAKG